MQPEGTFARPSRGGYARVLIDIQVEADSLLVEVALNDDAWNNQLKVGNYLDWLEGAIYGAEFASRTAEVARARVQIRRIVGLEVDTNPTNIAIAAARAVWNALEFEVPTGLGERMERAVMESSKFPSRLQSFDTRGLMLFSVEVMATSRHSGCSPPREHPE